MQGPFDKRISIKDLFATALEQDSASRSAFLHERCEDAEICFEVERLLREHEEAGTFLSTPFLEGLTGAVSDPTFLQRLGQGDLFAGRFRISHFIAAGGMGEVYAAEDTQLERTVALKFLSLEPARELRSLVRFQREAKAASALNHPNICTVYDIGEDRGRAFIAMELLEGETLSTRLKRGPCTLEEGLRIALSISSALAAAHSKGIIHRDIKPGNIMLTPSGAKLLDFGLALHGQFVSRERVTNSHFSRRRSCCDSIRCEMPGTARSSSENRQTGRAKSRFTMTIFHLPSRIESAASTLLALSNSKGVALRSEDSAISSVTNKSVRIPIAHPILSFRSFSRISGWLASIQEE